MGSKLDEANEFIAKAEKSLKTSFLKRKPDLDSAIEYYTKAALIFRNAKQLREAAELYIKVADLNFKLGSYFHCAKNYETASLIYKEMQEYDKIADLITRAGQLLRENGTPDTASYVYERAAKSLEQPLPVRAAELYELSAEAREIEENYHEAADQSNKAARMWVRVRKFPEAERALRHYMEYIERGNPDSVGATIGGFADSSAVPKLVARAVIVLILLKLHQEDVVAAEKIYRESVERWRFGETDENQSVSCLLNAMEQGDGDSAAKAIKASCFRTLDLDYVNLIKEIKLPKPSKTNKEPAPITSRPVTTTTTNPGTVAQGKADEEQEEEEEEDIC